jgi:hypothetical protein
LGDHFVETIACESLLAPETYSIFVAFAFSAS